MVTQHAHTCSPGFAAKQILVDYEPQALDTIPDGLGQPTRLGGIAPYVRFMVNVDINAHGGHYGSALQAASGHGHEAVVRLLLEKHADVRKESTAARSM